MIIGFLNPVSFLNIALIEKIVKARMDIPESLWYAEKRSEYGANRLGAFHTASAVLVVPRNFDLKGFDEIHSLGALIVVVWVVVFVVYNSQT